MDGVVYSLINGRSNPSFTNTQLAHIGNLPSHVVTHPEPVELPFFVQLIASSQSLFEWGVAVWSMEIPEIYLVCLECLERLIKMLPKVIGRMSDLTSPIVDVGIEFGVNPKTSSLPIKLSEVFLGGTLSIHTRCVNNCTAIFLEKVQHGTGFLEVMDTRLLNPY